MTTFLAELGTTTTPQLALSLLRGRQKAVELPDGTQVGMAHDFGLHDIKGRIALVCRVLLDDDRHDEIKHRLASGQDTLHVGEHPLVGAVGP